MIHPGLLIGIPTRAYGNPVPIEWAFAFKQLNPPINYNCVVHQVYGKPVAEARNDIVKEALKRDAKYLFFLGDDVICPPHTLKQLIFRLENWDFIGVVGGVYVSKSDPPAPLVFRGNGKGSYWDWKVGEFFEVTGLGMDCTLIKVDLFRQMQEPWFVTIDTDKFLDGIPEATQWTEDLYFLDRVLKETQYKIYCDATVICQHWDRSTNKFYTLPANSKPMRRVSVSGKKVLDIGSGPLLRDFGEDAEVIRFDINEGAYPDYRGDARQLPFEDNEFHIVFASHVLEHFDRHEIKTVFKEWLRVLKPGCKIIIVVPDLNWAAARLLDKDLLTSQQRTEQVYNVLYGAQSNIYDYHKYGFNEYTIRQLFEDFNLKAIKVEHSGYNLIAEGIK